MFKAPTKPIIVEFLKKNGYSDNQLVYLRKDELLNLVLDDSLQWKLITFNSHYRRIEKLLSEDNIL